MKILLTTGIYPPAIGGPALYVKNLEEVWRKEGHKVRVLYYELEKKLPTGIRHLLFFFRTILVLPRVDFVLALDTFSVGLPATLAARLFGKKIMIRTGGDFLWEGYIERTNDLVLLKDFYGTRRDRFSLKEKIIFKLTKWTLQNTSAVVFSTSWQRGIFKEAYELSDARLFIIENYYGPKVAGMLPTRKNFIAATRSLKWKNVALLEKAFEKAKETNPELILDLEEKCHEDFMQEIKSAYAVILVSLGDISPNMVLEALRFNKPVILTKETGLFEKLKDAVTFVDPEDSAAITEAILSLCDKETYEEAVRKAESFWFVHDWKEISEEYIALANTL